MKKNTTRKIMMMFIVSSLTVGMFGLIIAEAIISREPPTNVEVGLPFGGMILYSYYCSCSNTLLILVGPPMPFIGTIDASTIPYPFYQHWSTGVWSLGTYVAGGICVVPAGPYCVPIFYGPRVQQIGTSF